MHSMPYIGMPGIPYVMEYVKNILNIRYARNTLSTILAHWHIRTQSTIVCQEYLKHMGMPGIPYVLEYVRNIYSTIKVYQEYLKHNMYTEHKAQQYARKPRAVGMPGYGYARHTLCAGIFCTRGMPGISCVKCS